MCVYSFFFSSRRRHTRCSRDWSSDVCSSDLNVSQAFIPRDRKAQRACKSLEHCFNLMMRRPSVQHAQMHIGPCRLRKTLKEVLQQFHLKVAEAPCGDLCGHHAIRAAAQVRSEERRVGKEC